MAPLRSPRLACDSEDDLLRGKLKKLLLFRLGLAVFFLVLTLAVQSSRKADLLSTSLQPLYVLSCILFVFTIWGAISLERAQKLVRFAWSQLLFDIGAVTVLVFLSGGVESPFCLLYMLVIVSAALLLHRRASLLTASACSLVYGLALDLQYFGWVSPLQIVSETQQPRDSETYFFTILMNVTGYFLVGFLAGYLSRELQKSGRRIHEHEQNLLKLATLHQSIVESMTSGLLTVDTDGTISFSNRTAREILGLDEQAIAQGSVGEIFAGAPILLEFPGSEACEGAGSEEREARSVKREAKGKEQEAGSGKGGANPESATRMETTYTHPSGRQLLLGYSASVLQNGNGKPFGWIIIFRDLTELKATEEHMQRMERLVLAGKFAAEIAHEIKNPLAAMSGAIQLLQTEVGQNTLHIKLTSIIEREIGRINELATEFLWLTKESPRPGQAKNVPVCPVIEEILSLLRAKNQITASHSIKTLFHADPMSLIDPHHLRQIMWNLLVNSLEAMPEGGELLITVSRDGQSESETRIDISDTGCGIPETAHKRIFDPFFTTKTNGTGLGLSIVYQLVAKAGGRIEANAHPRGSGSVFSLFFPAM